MNWLGVFSKTPFIDYSRKNRKLYQNLLKDDFNHFEEYILQHMFLRLIKRELLFVHITLNGNTTNTYLFQNRTFLKNYFFGLNT